MLAYHLPESLTHKNRRYTLVPVVSDLADGALVIRMGEVGPRGGTSKLSVEAYLVQEVEPDPQFRPSGRTFLVCKLGTWPRRVDDMDVGRRGAEVYEVCVPPHGTRGYCVCDGWRMVGTCKHYDTFWHLVHCVGVERGFRPPRVEPVEVLTCGCDRDPYCEICGGSGVVEVETLGEFGDGRFQSA